MKKLVLKMTYAVIIFCVMITKSTYASNNMPSSDKPPPSDHSDGRVFHNLNPKAKPHGLLSLIKWRLNSKLEKWPALVPNEHSDTPPDRVYGDDLRVSFIGHATFLIQTQGLNIITDPVYSERCSPFTWAGPKRIAEPGIEFEKLPDIDIILVSHNHYDHLDIDTLKRLTKTKHSRIIVPIGNEKTIEAAIPHAHVEGLDWYEDIEVAEGIKVHLEPAQHWSARGIFDLNKALWGTFIISTKKGQICFIGDSGYDREMFKDIGEKFPNIILSLIPIGAYEPRWFMKPVHMNPEEAVRAHIDLGSKHSIASHFATFQLTDEGYDKPIKALKEAKEKLDVSNFVALKIGQFLLVK